MSRTVTPPPVHRDRQTETHKLGTWEESGTSSGTVLDREAGTHTHTQSENPMSPEGHKERERERDSGYRKKKVS